MKRIWVVLGLVGVCGVQVACGSDNDKTEVTKTACTPITPADLANPNWVASTCASGIYAKYGDAGFSAVTDTAVKLALSAPSSAVGTSFQDKLASASTTRQQEFTTNLKNFLASAFGGPAYTGPAMLQAHAGLNITVAQYNHFISEVVVPALTQNNVPQADIDCMAPVVTDPTFMATVITCK